MSRHVLKIALLIGGPLIAVAASAASGKIVSFDPPGGTETQPLAINASGTVVGRYQDSNGDGIQPGFIRDASGNFTALYGPVPGTTQTVPVSLNDAGQIAGWYSDGKTVHGFLRDTGGNYTTFDPPGSVSTTPDSINSAGQISGVYNTSGASTNVGFLRDSTGNFVTFGGPGSCGDAVVNAVLSTSGEVAGTCSYHGGRRYTFFIRTASGILTEYGNVFGGTVIFVQAINDHNILAGYYTDAAGLAHGFWGDSSGIHSFDYPGDLSTVPMGINLAGTITGFYYDGVDDVRHGFVRDQLGNFTNFDDPNAGTQGTTPLAINRSGQITGQFVGVHLVTHGFLRR